jgi:hypothetical protein
MLKARSRSALTESSETGELFGVYDRNAQEALSSGWRCRPCTAISALPERPFGSYAGDSVSREGSEAPMRVRVRAVREREKTRHQPGRHACFGILKRGHVRVDGGQSCPPLAGRYGGELYSHRSWVGLSR